MSIKSISPLRRSMAPTSNQGSRSTFSNGISKIKTAVSGVFENIKKAFVQSTPNAKPSTEGNSYTPRTTTSPNQLILKVKPPSSHVLMTQSPLLKNKISFVDSLCLTPYHFAIRLKDSLTSTPAELETNLTALKTALEEKITSTKTKKTAKSAYKEALDRIEKVDVYSPDFKNSMEAICDALKKTLNNYPK